MDFLNEQERTFLGAVSELAHCNPFLPERIDLERSVLGPEFLESEPVWSMQVDDPKKPRANSWRVHEHVESLVDLLRQRLLKGVAPGQEDRLLYQNAVLYLLFYRYTHSFFEATFPKFGAKGSSRGRWSFYDAFLRDWDHYLALPGAPSPGKKEASYTFAGFFQIHRAFYHIFEHIIGSSLSAARLRAAVWQSIFTHDMQRYRRFFYDRMGDFATLITGPSGTGKELVARAIALSRYLPFEERNRTFGDDLQDSFHPINLAALAPTLIESELFGHRRGAFTGALQDRRGWLELCPHLGSVFLDEIGDLDTSIQVKLLRVIETRTFQPVGGSDDRRFQGKLIAATNRDLSEAIQEGGFREDLYYRLCSDLIVMPSLHEQLRESPDVLAELVLFMAKRIAGSEAEGLAEEAGAWIRTNLGPDYRWPGNYRELEQCVRNLVVRHQYRPVRSEPQGDRERFLHDVNRGNLTADQLLRHYCTLVFAETGSYVETARRLELDRRTVKSKVDRELVAKFAAGASGR